MDGALVFHLVSRFCWYCINPFYIMICLCSIHTIKTLLCIESGGSVSS